MAESVKFDPNDLPEGHRAVPMVLTQSHGGPYEDHAFAAGYQVGSLATAMLWISVPGDVVPARIPRVLVGQLDLLAMAQSLVMDVRDIPGQPEWVDATFKLAP